MPIYQCSAPVGILTKEMKSRVAMAITDAHVEATGAPRVFVHVFFAEIPAGIGYSAGEIDNGFSGITGAIRAGRTVEVKQKLLNRIADSWCEITGQPKKHLLAGLSEIDSETTMEFGIILPHPGGEKEWFEKNAVALDGIKGDGI